MGACAIVELHLHLLAAHALSSQSFRLCNVHDDVKPRQSIAINPDRQTSNEPYQQKHKIADVTSAPQRWRAVLPIRHDELRCLPVLEAAEQAATESATKHTQRCSTAETMRGRFSSGRCTPLCAKSMLHIRRYATATLSQRLPRAHLPLGR